ncbi:MAG: hypothetical protein TU35_002075 [Thermoproteus sp. AZ2]|jgi:hypothetical protein|uniref:Uncharacterized protein n=1 Tax=Thermoproteus sp. AZ2 TaxID=1609232 RepID=A0ACC6UYY3_9CREN|nr:MAG: hypothetical protein TU35_06025 [Thermoproteus sp. AZ2]
MRTALAAVLVAYALLVAYLYIGGLFLDALRVRVLAPISVGDLVAVALIAVYGYAVYRLGKALAKAKCSGGRR